MRILRTGLTVLFDEVDFGQFLLNISTNTETISLEKPNEFPVAVIYRRVMEYLVLDYLYLGDCQNILSVIEEYKEE
jgi:hypothetical protein